MSAMKAVVFDFAETRAGEHARTVLDKWQGRLVCDDFSGYKTLFRQGITEAGCMAHARCKFHALWANHKSQIADEALKLFGVLYDIERQVVELDTDGRRQFRQQHGRAAADMLHAWLLAQRQRVPDGSATAKAIDYSLGRWGPLTHYLDDGDVPIDNNWVENRIRPIALGRAYPRLAIMEGSRRASRIKRLALGRVARCLAFVSPVHQPSIICGTFFVQFHRYEESHHVHVYTCQAWSDTRPGMVCIARL